MHTDSIVHVDDFDRLTVCADCDDDGVLVEAGGAESAGCFSLYLSRASAETLIEGLRFALDQLNAPSAN